MKQFRISIAIVLSLTVAIFLFTAAGSAQAQNGTYAKNIIFMVPDGMGLADVTATRIFKFGPNGGRLAFEKLPVIGYQSTHSANSTVTDSAAAAGAWACGEKFKNGEISCHADENGICTQSPQTVLENAKLKGMATGLVATSTITHATPAVFAAHTNSRKCETEIARQFVEVTGVDVILGGGIGSNSSDDKYNCAQYAGQDKDAVIASAQSLGYTVARTKSEMQAAVNAGVDRILGIFTPYGKTPENYRLTNGFDYPPEEPVLPEMTLAALQVLEKNNNGFFLVIEGSQIDWANHANNCADGDVENDYGDLSPTKIGEMLAFEAAVTVVLDWINASAQRQQETLLVVAADHETGGFAIDGPYGTLSSAGDVIEDGWTSGSHSAVDTIIWAQGPYSSEFGRALDNTDFFGILNMALGN